MVFEYDIKPLVPHHETQRMERDMNLLNWSGCFLLMDLNGSSGMSGGCSALLSHGSVSSRGSAELQLHGSDASFALKAGL